MHCPPAVAGARMGAAEEMVNKQTAAGPHITQHNTIETNLCMIHMACVNNIHCGVWINLNLGSLGSAEVYLRVC